MKNSVIVQNFLSYLKFEKRFSIHTAKCYGADLLQFGQFVIEHTGQCQSGEHDYSTSNSPALATSQQTEVKLDQKLLAIEVEDLRAYMVCLNEKQYSKSTIARKLATLRSFYKEFFII